MHTGTGCKISWPHHYTSSGHCDGTVDCGIQIGSNTHAASNNSKENKHAIETRRGKARGKYSECGGTSGCKCDYAALFDVEVAVAVAVPAGAAAPLALSCIGDEPGEVAPSFSSAFTSCRTCYTDREGGREIGESGRA